MNIITIYSFTAILVVLLVLVFSGCTTTISGETTATTHTGQTTTTGATTVPTHDSSDFNTSPPSETARLVFIHHSVGLGWLSPDWGGNLIGALNDNNYYVTDTYYGWGPDGIGDYTDIGHWHDWFLGQDRDTYLNALYNNDELHEDNENSIPDPGGENDIVMFKSCYVGAGTTLYGNPGDQPTARGQDNPIYGRGADDDWDGSAYTVSNVKGLYRDLLDYFSTQTDRLFVFITTPPYAPGEDVSDVFFDNLRAINTWLVEYVRDEYSQDNVMVFDYSCVLTSNGGSAETNDIGATTGSHHRYVNGYIEHTLGPNAYLAYTYGDSHPEQAGHLKATAEFLPLLNIAYNDWVN